MPPTRPQQNRRQGRYIVYRITGERKPQAIVLIPDEDAQMAISRRIPREAFDIHIVAAFSMKEAIAYVHNGQARETAPDVTGTALRFEPVEDLSAQSHDISSDFGLVWYTDDLLAIAPTYTTMVGVEAATTIAAHLNIFHEMEDVLSRVKHIDWAAYMGAAPIRSVPAQVVRYVVARGNKIDGKLADHIFLETIQAKYPGTKITWRR